MREGVSMGRFIKGLSNESPEQIDAAVHQAREAWDAGLLCYVYKPRALATLDNKALSVALDRMLRIGWDLHSTSLSYGQTGPNVEMAMFTFLRPGDVA